MKSQTIAVKKAGRRLIAFATACGLIACSSLRAATITVSNSADSGVGTLRAALINAASGDTIVFSFNGRIRLTTGELSISKDLRILGPGPSKLAIDGNAASRVFHIMPSNAVVLAGLAITNGAADLQVPASGGGIYNQSGSLTISNCVIKANRAYSGAGIFSTGNYTPLPSPPLQIVDTIVSENYTVGPTGGGSINGTGGGMYWEGSLLVVSNCAFIGNNASQAQGGIAAGVVTYGADCLARITDTTVSSNSGGGLGFNGNGLTNAIALVNNCTVSGNIGMGILNTGFMQITNCTISGNVSFTGPVNVGRGIWSAGGGTVWLFNSTVVSNGSDEEPGGNLSVMYSSHLVVGSTIIAFGRNNPLSPGTGNIYRDSNTSTVLSLGYNLCSDAGGNLLTNVTDQLNTDPLLGPLQNNGGPTLTHGLLGCSPAIDRGKNFAASGKDQRGLPRTFDDIAMPNSPGGDGTDVGAYEAQSHVNDATPPAIVCPSDIMAIETPGSGGKVVSFAPTASDNCDSNPVITCVPASGSVFPVGTNTVAVSVVDAAGNSNQCSFTVTVVPFRLLVINTNDSGPGSLRQAIDDANAVKGDNLIEFAPSAYGRILLTNGEFLITDDVTIKGPGPALLALDGNVTNTNVADNRVFHILSSNIVTLSGMTITNGGRRDYIGGGGIFNQGSTLTVCNCMLCGNFARSPMFPSDGGAILNWGRLTIASCTLRDNDADEGGAIAGVSQTDNAGLSAANCIFQNNSADVGGGIFNWSSGPASGLVVERCTFVGNQSPRGSGIRHLDSFGPEALISDSSFTGNSGIAIVSEAASQSYAQMRIVNCNVNDNAGVGILSDIGLGTATLTMIRSQVSSNGGTGISSSGTLSISESTVSGNGDSGIRVSGNAEIINTTLSGNSASAAGGGIFADPMGSNAVVTLANSTLSGNSASSGGGIYAGNSGSPGVLTLNVWNSTFSENHASSEGSGVLVDGLGTTLKIGSTVIDMSAPGSVNSLGVSSVHPGAAIISQGYNLSRDNSGGFLTHITDRTNTDPLLGPFQDNGGPNFTYSPLNGSPLLDQGKNFSTNSTDQRGFSRTFDKSGLGNAFAGDGTDIGAVEVALIMFRPAQSSFNAFEFKFTGEPGPIVVIEASTNLQNWIVLTTNVLGVTPTTFSDPAAATWPMRFYRLRVQ